MAGADVQLRADAQELRVEADRATLARRDLAKAALAAIVALVEHDRRTLAELRALAARIERASAEQQNP